MTNQSTAIIADTHFKHSNYNGFLEYQINNFKKFIQYAKDNNIKRIIHLGDMFDNNTSTNYEVQTRVLECFDMIEAYQINTHVIIGNHDIFYKNKLYPNSFSHLISQYKYINTVHEKGTVIDDMLLVNWFTKDEEGLKKLINIIENDNSKVLLGHFELNGFDFNSNRQCTTGVPKELLSKYDKVLSGHFHSRQTKENIHYIGSAYQMNFGDIGERRGFVIMNSNKELQYINFDDIFIECNISELSEQSNKIIKCIVAEDDKIDYDLINKDVISVNFVTNRKNQEIDLTNVQCSNLDEICTAYIKANKIDAEVGERLRNDLKMGTNK